MVLTSLVGMLALAAGDLSWESDTTDALRLSKETHKPVVLLFGVGPSGKSC